MFKPDKHVIAVLERAPPDATVEFDGGAGPTRPHSYRGYYSDLAFEMGDPITVSDLLQLCKEALGSTFTGYKGGDFIMGNDTPLWAASYGCCGPAIISATQVGGKIVLATKEIA